MRDFILVALRLLPHTRTLPHHRAWRRRLVCRARARVRCLPYIAFTAAAATWFPARMPVRCHHYLAAATYIYRLPSYPFTAFLPRIMPSLFFLLPFVVHLLLPHVDSPLFYLPLHTRGALPPHRTACARSVLVTPFVADCH